MWDTILEALIDSLKALPVLYLLYLLLEFLEHKRKVQFENVIVKSKKVGPLLGAGIGCIPQCAFGTVMADLYSKRMITIGTLFAVFIATSDEAIPVMIAEPSKILMVLLLLGLKLVLAIIIGFAIDLIFKKQAVVNLKVEDHEHDEKCTHDHCCADNIFWGSLKHTLEIFAYVLIANLLINILVFFIGEPQIEAFLNQGIFLQPIFCALIGLIPNCAASVILVELYLSNILTFGSLLGGLCSSAGIGLIILFKKNKNIKQNLLIVLMLFVIGAVIGLLFNLLFPMF